MLSCLRGGGGGGGSTVMDGRTTDVSSTCDDVASSVCMYGWMDGWMDVPKARSPTPRIPKIKSSLL